MLGLEFVGESVLMVVFQGRDGVSKEVKLLYCTKFYPGSFAFLEEAFSIDNKRVFREQEELVLGMVRHAELESSLDYEVEKDGAMRKVDLSSLRGQLIKTPGDSSDCTNYSNVVNLWQQNVMFLNGQKVLRARVFSWKEFLNIMRQNRNSDWLSILKVAMEIFNGDAKGFAFLPDSKEQREEELVEYMREMILKIITQEVDKNLKNVNIEYAPQSILDSC